MGERATVWVVRQARLHVGIAWKPLLTQGGFMRKALWFSAIVLAVALAAVIGLARTAVAGPEACGSRANNTHAKLLECVTLEGVREHQAAFQAIADANGGTRASGTPGYDASVLYVVDRMTAAGYNVTLNPFP